MFYTGVCNSFTEIKNAIVDVCTSNGWAATTDSGGQTVIYKDTMFLRIIPESLRISFLGRTSIDGGDAPYEVCITHFNAPEVSIAFPVIYYAFVFDYEVFFIIEYGERFQYVAFGKSTYTLPGTGMWVSATARRGALPTGIMLEATGSMVMYATSGAMFWSYNYSSDVYYAAANSWIHTNIDPNYPWALGTANFVTSSSDVVGIQYLTELISAQPNYFNQEALLLPIKAFKRSVVYADKCHEVLTVQNARHFNLSYVQPKDIIYRGSEQWMVFPWFRRSLSPYGWAIRKA